MSRKVRKALDKLIGTEKIFTHKDKEAIYSKIERKEVDQMKSRRKKWGIPFIYGLTAALLFVLVWAGIPHNKTPEKASSVHKTSEVHKTSKVQKTSSKKKKQPNQQSLTLGASKHSLLNEKPKLVSKEAKQYPKKFQIVKTMYYSWDHIHNIQGQIEAGIPRLKVKGETTFYLDLDHQLNWAKLLKTKNGKLDLFEKVLYKNHKITLERPKKKIFTKWRFQNQRKTSSNVYEALNFEDGNVTNGLWYRWLTDNYQNWSYKEGTKLDMPVYEIAGTTSWGVPFSMTLAKNTGILLDFKEYDKKNHSVLTDYMTVTQIKVDKGIPASQFQLDVSGDKKVSFVGYNSSIGGGGVIDRGKICASNCTMN